MAYRMTAARKRALRKAQLISARVRRRMGSAKLSRGHKRAIATVVAGAAVVGGAYGTNKLMNATKLMHSNAARDAARQRIVNRRNRKAPDLPDGTKSINAVLAKAKKAGAASAPPRGVTPGDFAHIVRIRNSAPQSVKDLLAAQKGTPVKSVYHGVKAVKRKWRIQYGDYEMTGVDDDNNPIWEWKATSKPQ